MGVTAVATGWGCLQTFAMGLGLPISVATLWTSVFGKIGYCPCCSDGEFPSQVCSGLWFLVEDCSDTKILPNGGKSDLLQGGLLLLITSNT